MRTKQGNQKNYLKKDSAIQFEALENANTFKNFYSKLAGGFQEKLSILKRFLIIFLILERTYK